MSAISTPAGSRLHRRRNVLLIVAGLILAGAVAGGIGLWYVLIGPPGPALAAPVIPA